MRLLVTRPEPDATETAERLRALGHSVIVQPMLDIAFAEPPANAAPPAAILLTSRNALRALLRWPAAKSWREVPVFAVGTETAALAQGSGFADVRVGGGDARGLVELVAAQFDPRRGAILYPAAAARAADIEGLLRERGIRVELVEAYRAVSAKRLNPEVEEALRRGAIDGVLFFSRRTAAAFRDAAVVSGVETALKRILFYALSDEVAVPLRGLTGMRIRVAARPDSEALFAILPAARQ